MSFSARFARLRGPVGLVAAAAMGASALLPLAASAQQAQPQQQPRRPAAQQPAAPAQQPAAPAAPAAGAAQQPNAGPTIVQVKPEPSQTDWTKVCGKDQAAGTEICYTTRDFVSDQGQPVLAVAVYDVKGAPAGQPAKIVRFLMPLGLMLSPGIRFAVDQGQPVDGKYAICFQNGCFAESSVTNDQLNAFKKGQNLNVSVQNQIGRVVTFQVPLGTFGKAFDGPAIDPKVLEEQQKKLQEELERRSDEMRKRLESSAAGAAAPGATPPKQ